MVATETVAVTAEMGEIERGIFEPGLPKVRWSITLGSIFTHLNEA
jgi:hypothetical protein